MSWILRSFAHSPAKRDLDPAQPVRVTDDTPSQVAPSAGRLNIFQRTMLRWRALYPYNAIHVVRVARPLDRSRLEGRIRRELEHCGLTGLALDRERRSFRYEGGPADTSLRVVDGGSDSVAVVAREVERELNTPFPQTGPTTPFRFFAVDAGDSFHLGLAYDHFVAGGDSIVAFLKALVERDGSAAVLQGARPGSGPHPGTYRGVLARHPGYALRAVASLPGLLASSRRCFRPHYARDQDLHNGFAYYRLGPDRVDSLLRTGKAWGVTFNDLLLAALLKALDPLTGERKNAPVPKGLAVTAIVNVRPDFGPEARDAFGQFLSSFRVAHPVPAGISLYELASDVHTQTTRIKRDKLHLQSVLALGIGGLMWPFLRERRRLRFFLKNAPLWGGLTTMNVDALWGDGRGSGTPAPDYVRAGSTGPLAPLVLTVTTASGLHLGVSYRTAAFSPATIDRVMAEFRSCIEISE
jgi:hypothetical protein